MSVVSVSDLSVSYDRTVALDGVTVTVSPGELVVVLGMNGSGKTTMMKAMAGLLAPERGSVRLFDGMPLRQARARIAAVFDEPVHWDTLTGWENARFFARCYGLSNEEADRQLGALFRWTGLWDRRNDPAGEYSFGMRRKLTLIEALAHRPHLLLIDEPSIGLDLISRLALHRRLREMVAEGRSVVVATNDLGEASALADRACILHKGKVAAMVQVGDLDAFMGLNVRMSVRLTSPVDPSALRDVPGVGSIIQEDDRNGPCLSILMPSTGDAVDGALLRVVERLTVLGAGLKEIKVERPGIGDLLLELSEASGDGPS